jgi:hypothetical protein
VADAREAHPLEPLLGDPVHLALRERPPLVERKRDVLGHRH